MAEDRADHRPRPGAFFEARCAWCGPVRLGAAALTLHLREEGESLFEFTCSRCARVNVRSIERPDLLALLHAGVRPSTGPSPFELLEVHPGPPLTLDDLIDLHEALARRDGRVRVHPDGHREHRKDAA